MQVTILGKSPSWEDAGGACSGYLIEEGDTAVLLDCGNGVFSKLRMHRDYTATSRADLATSRRPRPRPRPVRVRASPTRPASSPCRSRSGRARTTPPGRALAPPGARRTFHRVAEAFGSDDLLDKAFRVTSTTRPGQLTGGLRASFHEVPHFTTTYAISTSANGVGRFTYGADCRPSEAGRCGARHRPVDRRGDPAAPERAGERGHMTPAGR